MEARADVHQWFTAILTTYVVEANLGAALQCVAVQRVAELDKASLEQRGLAEQGVRHLLTYVDAETLYRAALGVYELEVAYLVVNCSSKDPAEHLLQLQVWHVQVYTQDEQGITPIFKNYQPGIPQCRSQPAPSQVHDRHVLGALGKRITTSAGCRQFPSCTSTRAKQAAAQAVVGGMPT